MDHSLVQNEAKCAVSGHRGALAAQSGVCTPQNPLKTHLVSAFDAKLSEILLVGKISHARPIFSAAGPDTA